MFKVVPIMASSNAFELPSNVPSDYKEIIFDTLCKMEEHVEGRGPRYVQIILRIVPK